MSSFFKIHFTSKLSSKINHKMKTLIVAFMLLFSCLDTLPKLYDIYYVSITSGIA